MDMASFLKEQPDEAYEINCKVLATIHVEMWASLILAIADT